MKPSKSLKDELKLKTPKLGTTVCQKAVMTEISNLKVKFNIWFFHLLGTFCRFKIAEGGPATYSENLIFLPDIVTKTF